MIVRIASSASSEVLMARWKGDVLPLFEGAARGDLRGVEPAWEAPASLCVVMAAAGYPATPRKHDVITGLADARTVPGVQVFHAGTAQHDGAIVTSGGRVLCVTAIGDDLDQAAERAYTATSRISFAGAQLRHDIGWQARTR